MPRKRYARDIPAVERAFSDAERLRKPEDGAGVLYLPTTHLTCTVEEFKAALERHDMVVTQVEGHKAFRAQGPPDMGIDWSSWGSNFYDRFDWTDKDTKPIRVAELRILPYLLRDFLSGSFVALWFDRPVRPEDDLSLIRTSAWPLTESMSAHDESEAVKQCRAEKNEKERLLRQPVAGWWVRTDDVTTPPQVGVEVPILVVKTKRSKPQMHLGIYCHAEDNVPAGWVNEHDGEYYRANKVTHWMKVAMP